MSFDVGFGSILVLSPVAVERCSRPTCPKRYVVPWNVNFDALVRCSAAVRCGNPVFGAVTLKTSWNVAVSAAISFPDLNEVGSEKLAPPFGSK
ncbi:MAG: hypothetical protein M3Q23_18695 [Actinomycetota bacterium]|nr:hypothetical protein [Actinomycetota bacterium]